MDKEDAAPLDIKAAMERDDGSMFFNFFPGWHFDSELGRTGKISTVRYAESVLCQPNGLYGFRFQCVFLVFIETKDACICAVDVRRIYQVWSLCAGRGIRMVCVFAWLFICKRACLHGFCGNDTGDCVHLSANFWLHGRRSRIYKNIVWTKPGTHYANWQAEGVEKSEAIFHPFCVPLHGCRGLAGKLRQSGFAESVYPKDVNTLRCFIDCLWTACAAKIIMDVEVWALNLDQNIIQKLCMLSREYQVEKLLLFGSRARGTNYEYSDIDLAAWGIRSAAQYLDFQDAIEEQVPTLLRFDLVDMNASGVSDELRREVEKDGVVLYEKI